MYVIAHKNVTAATTVAFKLLVEGKCNNQIAITFRPKFNFFSDRVTSHKLKTVRQV
jgi:hypothetical protein